MFKKSLITKIMLWFSISLIIVVSITYITIIEISDQIIKKTIRDNLIEIVENNVDEIEYFFTIDTTIINNDIDYYIEHNNGFIEIDDDFLNEVNDVYTGLYSEDYLLIYGENPIIEETNNINFIDSQIQKITINDTLYYIFDRQLTSEGLEGLWLRGIVSEEQGEVQLSSISKTSLIILPTIVLITIWGGYIIIRHSLYPIKKMTKEIQEISQEKDLKRRIDVGKRKDELYILANNFNEMLNRLEKSFKIEKQFTADASHELRTPITVITAQTNLLSENNSTIADYKEGLKVINRQSNKMTKLVNDMLLLARIDQNNNQTNFEIIDMSKLVKEVCNDMKLIKINNITLESNIEKNINLYGNKELLERLLINLITNAFYYGNNSGHIWVTLEKNAQNIKLIVKDDGIGISKNDQKKIFNRFYKVDKSRHQNSNGLGLSMVMTIINLHNGTIEVKSKINKGSTFIITFKIT